MLPWEETPPRSSPLAKTNAMGATAGEPRESSSPGLFVLRAGLENAITADTPAITEKNHQAKGRMADQRPTPTFSTAPPIERLLALCTDCIWGQNITPRIDTHSENELCDVIATIKLSRAATMAKGQDMNEHQTELDQTDEDILTYTVSDEALETAAGTGVGFVGYTRHFRTIRTIPDCC